MNQARKDLSAGFTADDDRRPTRDELRRRKMDRVREAGLTEGGFPESTPARTAPVPQAAPARTAPVPQADAAGFPTPGGRDTAVAAEALGRAHTAAPVHAGGYTPPATSLFPPARVDRGPLGVPLSPGRPLSGDGDLTFQPADTSAAPADQLRHYERTIGQARLAVQALLRTAHDQWVLTAGQALREIRDGHLYLQAGHTSFDGYVQARWNMQRAHAYRLIEAVPVVRALAGVAHAELKERQVRALVPVGKIHGDEAVRAVWREAAQRGRTSGAALQEVAARLGYGGGAEPASGPRSSDCLTALRRAWKAIDASTIRAAADQDPHEARRLVADLRRVLDEAEAVLRPAPPGASDHTGNAEEFR